MLPFVSPCLVLSKFLNPEEARYPVLQVQPVRLFNYFPLQLLGAFGLNHDLIPFLSCLLSCLHGEVFAVHGLFGLAKFFISTTIFIEGFLCFQSVISFSEDSNSACGTFIESDPVLFLHQNWWTLSACSLTWALKVVCLALEAIANLFSYSRFSVILTTRASNSFSATTTGNATYMYSNRPFYR